MRCLALAQQWRAAGGDVCFVLREATDKVLHQLEEVGPSVVLDESAGAEDDLATTTGRAQETDAGWIVVDDYGLGPADWSRLAAHSRVLVIDDLGGASSYPVDIVLNQNIHARADLYTIRKRRPRLLLGTKFALLREEITALRPAASRAEDVLQVLLTVGGGDHLAVLREIVAACCDLPVNLRALTGSGAPDAQASLTAICPEVETFAEIENPGGLMAAADAAVTGAGSSCWEFAFLGVPIVTVALADNQVPVAEGLEAAGAALNAGRAGPATAKRVGWLLEAVSHDAQLRRKLGENGRRLVDGRGRERVVAQMRKAV